MRRLATLAVPGVAVLALGCLPGCRRDVVPDAPSPAVTSKQPTAPELVAYMNDNARLLQSIKSTNLEIDAREGRESIGLAGSLFCQKPRDFRLRSSVAGMQGVDIGSNKDEFWFYIGQAKDQDGVARVHYCSYPDMAAGKARMPFPFQPDMIVAALGMGEYRADADYSVRTDAKTISLVEPTTSAQGQPVQRVTVFNRTQAAAGQPQVLAHVLLDDKGNEICRASILNVQTVQVGQERAVIPQRVKLVWRAQQIEMTMWLKDAQVNSIDAAKAAKVFSRADLASIPAANLAQTTPDSPSGYSQMSIQRTGLTVPATK